MAVISLDLAIQAKAGQETPSFVNVPLPKITDENVCEWANDQLPDDWYCDPGGARSGRGQSDHRRRPRRRAERHGDARRDPGGVTPSNWSSIRIYRLHRVGRGDLRVTPTGSL